MNRHVLTSALLTLALLVLVSGCGTAETPVPTPPPGEGPPSNPIEWVLNGEVSENEYPNALDFDEMRIWWRNDDTYLYVALEGETEGWIAVGLNPEQGMQGADYFFGYVDADGEVHVWDAYGTAPQGNAHPPDEELGGTNDILAYVGVQEGGVTRFEYQIMLNSGDAHDVSFRPGERYPFILAIGDEDSFEAYHRKYVRGEMALTP